MKKTICLSACESSRRPSQVRVVLDRGSSFRCVAALFLEKRHTTAAAADIMSVRPGRVRGREEGRRRDPCFLGGMGVNLARSSLSETRSAVSYTGLYSPRRTVARVPVYMAGLGRLETIARMDVTWSEDGASKWM